MARRIPVTYGSQALQELEKPGRYRVADGLYVRVENRNGGIYKRWIYRYQTQGVRTEVGFGAYPAVGIQAAKLEAAERKKALDEKKEDPKEAIAEDKAKLKATKLGQKAAAQTFEAVAEKFMKEVKRKEWKGNGKSESSWRYTLGTFAYPVIGNKTMETIDQDDVKNIVGPIWVSTHETAQRTLGRIRSIFDYYKATNKKFQLYNPAQYSGQLEYVLPKINGDPVNLAALPYQEFPNFYSELLKKDDASYDALKLIALTAQRQLDVRSARRDQFDLDNGLWNCYINKRRRDEDKIHRVPLSRQAVTMLKRRMELSDSEEFVFPSESGNSGFITEGALRKSLGTFGRTDEGGRNITMHGFRTTLMNWSQVFQLETDKLVEQQLAHAEKKQTLAAYMRADLLGRRAVLMQKYADYATGSFVPEVPS